MIQEAAVEAAAERDYGLGWADASEWERSAYLDHATNLLEAAAPHMLAGAKADALDEAADDVSLRIDQIEAHQVPESEYGTLLAQREEAVGIYRDIRTRATKYRTAK